MTPTALLALSDEELLGLLAANPDLMAAVYHTARKADLSTERQIRDTHWFRIEHMCDAAGKVGLDLLTAEPSAQLPIFRACMDMFLALHPANSANHWAWQKCFDPKDTAERDATIRGMQTTYAHANALRTSNTCQTLLRQLSARGIALTTTKANILAPAWAALTAPELAVILENKGALIEMLASSVQVA